MLCPIPSSAVLALACSIARAGIDELRITEVNPADDSVEVTHFADSSFTTASTLPFCHLFNYSSFIPSGTQFGPRESKVFSVSGLNDTASDIWLYRDVSFASSTSILTGIAYGSGNLGRSSVATAAGIWPSAGSFVPPPAAGESLRLTDFDSTDPDLWESLTPQPGEFFTTVTNPLPPLSVDPDPIGLQRVLDSQTKRNTTLPARMEGWNEFER